MAGRTVTSTPGIKDDLTNAGATWVDRAVVTDGHIVSARRPPDLPAFGGAIIDFLSDHPHFREMPCRPALGEIG
jgi:protease I